MIFKRFHKSLFATLCAFVIWVGLDYSVSSKGLNFSSIESLEYFLLQEQDTTKQDTLKRDSARNVPYTPSRQPNYQPSDRYGDPFSNSTSSSPLMLQDPASLQLDVDIDTSMNYTIYEKIGDVNYRPTSSMTFAEFKQYQEKQQLKDYWKSRSEGLDGESAVSGRNLIPPIYISPVFDRIFGGTYVEIIPRGFVTLDFGGRWQRISNPNIPIRQQRSGGFEFDQQISMNVVGKVGEKLQVTANFDNNNSFDFENNLKVEYTGYEEDILQKLEIGNVSLPLNNSLITGAQNLFGIKAQMQFGDLYVTTVASTQRGKSESITIDGGGAQGREFEVQASNYDENRHFFLGHFFRDNYEDWLSTIPNINSGVNITRLEVYVVNTNNNTQTLRNVVGLMDLAEPDTENLYRDTWSNGTATLANANGANSLFEAISGITKNADQVDGALQGLGLEDGLDYEKITSARKLDLSEYTYHTKLGYVTLNRRLQNDEALAVAYQYSYRGQNYQVGELSTDYSSRPEDNVIFLKLLRPKKISITDNQNFPVPTWDLMMKNIYNLSGTNIEEEGFELRVIYRDDNTGIDNPQLQEGTEASQDPLIRLLNLDRLNQNEDPQPDGNFDYVEDVTIDSENGLIIFPDLKPFADPLREAFQSDPPGRQQTLIDKYVYDELYEQTKIDAELVSNKNKYVIVGKYQAGSSTEIVIPGFNIAEGSVRVYAGGSPLQEGVDYQVDYTFGKVNILNEGVLNSGKQITISYEKADLFNFQSRTLLGARFDYKLDDDVTFGATLLHLNERPLISRISVGNEPIRNTKYGFDVNVQKDSRFLTKMLDKLPLIQTKEPSSISFNAEFAQLIPGTSNIVDGEGTSYIDDFESSATPYSLSNPTTWKLAATPETDDNRFFGESADLENGYKRARLAWYTIDNLFYRNDRRKPDNITDEELENNYVRQVIPQEIFPNRDQNVINIQQTFDLAYYPAERGQYNLNSNETNNDGVFTNNASIRRNWGGITSAINTEIDFDKANIEYIEFWLMDPFINNANGNINDGRGNNRPNTTGGDMYFNLGTISEDVIPDNKHGFENGLPADGYSLDAPEGVEEISPWGYTTTQQFLTNAFDNSQSARANQDVGLNGMGNDKERNYPQYPQKFRQLEDPAGDDFNYFLGDELDQRNAGILERYKSFNGMENNSPVVSNNNALYTESGSTLPDNEDLNGDNTLNTLEEYYEYKVDLNPGDLENNDYVVDQATTDEGVNWYLFRIPIRQSNLNSYGNISGFKSIKYIRTYLTDWQEPVVLRMVNFRFVASRWRRYTNPIEDADFGTIDDNNLGYDDLTVSVVNVEENGAGSINTSPYDTPPGINRDRDNTSSVERRLNEQSLQLTVEGLEDGHAAASFKQVAFDLINYGRIKMFLHANSENAADDEVTAFLRLGSDVDSNYYEIEVPLKISNPSSSDPEVIWPEENEIDMDMDQLYSLKADRDADGISKRELFPLDGPRVVGNNRIRLRGNPDMSAVTWLTIGVRNPKDDGQTKDAIVWANELRVTDFDRTKGWAANATLNAKLADFANITATARHTTFGFGGIQSKIAERTREETTAYDVSANVNVDKLLPDQLGLKIPMYVSYEKTTIKPKFDPANPDITLEASLLNKSVEEKAEYESIVTDITTRKSINFTNVRKVKTNPEAKKRIYDIENLSFSYAYSEMERHNFNLREQLYRNYNASIAYNYSTQSKPWEPFQNVKFLDKSYLQLIKDFNINFLPSNIAVRGELQRRLEKTVYRNSENVSSQTNFEKYFYFNRTYNLQWDLTKNLTLDYNARAAAVIDEPDTDPNGGLSQSSRELITADQYQDSIMTNLKNLGRLKNFDQSISANYHLPIDKIPLTDWVATDYQYQAGYSWTAGPLYTEPEDQALNFGNTLQNSRDNTARGKLDLVKLYNKVGFLKKINNPTRNTRRSSLRRNQAQDSTETKQSENKFGKGFLRMLMAVRSINGTYTLREGTLLPGYTGRPFLFGMDSSFNEPGWGFILGSQDPSIRYRLADKGLITRNTDLTTPFTQTKTVDYNIKANIEPFKDLKIQLNMQKTKSSSYQEIFHMNADSTMFESIGQTRSGAYSVSFLSIATAFKRDDSRNNSPVFQDFEQYRMEILDEFERNTGVRYDTNSQDVLIPAFIAAYSGKSPNSVSLSPFPRTPLPNWRIDYAGLGKIKALAKIFQSISITHGYQSDYTVSNYSSEVSYSDGIDLTNGIESYNRTQFARDIDGEFNPMYFIDQVVIREQFAPLIGVNVRTKSRLSVRAEYKVARDVALQVTNAQVTEMRSNDVVLEVGFTKANFKLPFKSQGRVISLKNDLTFRLNVTVRDTETIQRKIDEVNTVTDGNLNFQLRPNVSYVLNEKLNIQFYFERSINEPKISSTFRRTTTRAGFQLRFSLAQ
ncbi:cell surface protein SprA [Fulvivirga maritima]|uniref:T9SS outer membrane translocon Sov/SprA n=1 Tax=Fulvivirga maritima TaxID=2904247 RepID=UPI001F1E5AAF|nr:cell surface protein SprA [Fulvivirga maritima]UII27749.1 cell surface protein SprA [Fulvivirga maritima]